MSAPGVPDELDHSRSPAPHPYDRATAAGWRAAEPGPVRTIVLESAALRGRGLFWAWTGVVTIAEVVGFLFPASAGVAAQSLPTTAGMVVVLGAGGVEGVFLGAAQQAVLRRALPGVNGRRWVALTGAAAVAAYALGFVLSYLGGVRTWAVVVPITVTAVVLLATIGGAQAIELRHHVRRAGAWIAWTALGWLAALATFLLIVTPLWHEGQSPVAATGVGILGGAAMAFVQAAVTGSGLLRVLAASPGRVEVGDSR